MESKDLYPTDSRGMLLVPREDLRVGMYVDLDCSWFKHPFPTKSFKITSQSQLTAIRALKIRTVLVDLHKSDPGLFPANALSNRCAAFAANAMAPSGQAQDKPQPADDGPNAPGKSYRQMVESSAKILKEILSGSADGVAQAKMLIGSLGTLVARSQHSNMIANLSTTQGMGDMSVLHALNVSTLAMMIGRYFELEQEELQMIGMAGFLHDIGEQRLPADILRKAGRLSNTDLHQYRQHPVYSLDILRRFHAFPEPILDIIGCHHERLDGSGYPAKLKSHQLPPKATLLMVADEYDTLINNPRSESSLTPAEALSYLYLTQQDSLSMETIAALVHTLGVYPPGTVVELSDGTFGLVISVNMAARMRPAVLVYDPTTPDAEPPLLDLSAQATPTITRSVPKHRIDPRIKHYLDLYRWTGYFLVASLPPSEPRTSDRAA